jgi:hypothetical protein
MIDPTSALHHQARGLFRRDMLALALSVFAAGLFGFGRPLEGALAQGITALPQGMPAQVSLQLGPSARAEVIAALAAMDAQALSLTYARIHATFRHHLGAADLSVARALVDYAALAEAELTRRATARPDGTESATDMLRLYELVL